MFVINCFIICLFVLDFIHSQGRVDGVSAIVGKNIILHSDILQQAQFIALEKKIDPSKSPYLFEEIYYSSRDNMINQYAILNIAEKDTNLIITNDEVDRALNQQIDDFILRAGSEERFLEMAGMSMRQIKADYWMEIRDMMVVERYQFLKIQNVDVARDEVVSFYNTYKDSIPSLPEQYDFSVIEIPFIASNESEKETSSFLLSLKNEIENKDLSFDSLAQIYSQDPGTASSGGYLGFTSRGTLVKAYEEVAYSLNPGNISNPIKTEFGYHLIRLIVRQGEKISTQHILRSIPFSENDKEAAYIIINNIVSQVDNDSIIFDSLANIYSKKYNNLSGKYQKYYPENIPENLLLNIVLLNNFEVSPPIETHDGYALIFYYNHQETRISNLENSWNLLYQHTKQNKQNIFFQSWINNNKNNVYIKIIKE